jgi:hypothetical protein
MPRKFLMPEVYRYEHGRSRAEDERKQSVGKGLREKSAELVDKGAEVYANT